MYAWVCTGKYGFQSSPSDRDEATHNYAQCSNPSVLCMWPETVFILSGCLHSLGRPGEAATVLMVWTDCKLNPRIGSRSVVRKWFTYAIPLASSNSESGLIVPISWNRRHADIGTLEVGQMLGTELGTPDSRVWVLPPW